MMDDFDPFEGEEEAVKPTKSEVPTASAVDVPTVATSNVQDDFDPFEEVERERRYAARSTLEGDAVQSAQVRGLADRFGVSRTAAGVNREAFEKQAAQDDMDRMLTETPFFASWLASNPLDAPIFQNDLGAIKEIEDGFRTVGHLITVDPYQKTAWDKTHTSESLGIYEIEGMEDPENSTGNPELDRDIEMRRRPEFIAPLFRSAAAGVKAGYLMGEKGAFYHKAMMGETAIDDDFKRRSRELDEAIEKATGTYGDDWMYSAGQILGTMGSAATNASEGATLGATLGLAGGLAAGASGPFAGLTMGGLFALSAATGMTDATQKIEGGLAYADMLEAGTDPLKARYISQGVGAMNALIEMAGLSVLGDAAGPVLRKAIADRTVKTVAALEDPSLMRALSQVGKAYGIGVGQEVVTEVMQEGVNIVGEEIARTWGEGVQDPATVEAVVDRLADIAVQTAKGAAVLGGVGFGAGTVVQMKRVAEAQNTQLFFEKLNEAIPAMQAKNLSPDAVHQYIADQAKENGNPTTYIDAGDFYQAMIDNNVTMKELQAVLPDVAKSLEQAVSNGSDVEIATADYATKIAGTPLGGSLTQSVRLSPEALSARDAIKVQQAYQSMMQEITKNTFTTEKAGERFVDAVVGKQYKEKQKALEQSYAEALSATGQFDDSEAKSQAKLASAMVVNLAQRANLPIERIDKLAPKLVETSVGSSGEHFQSMVSSDEKLKTEAEAWKVLIGGLGKKPSQPVLMLKQTPVAMSLVGADFLELRAHPHVFDGMFIDADRSSANHHAHPAMTRDVLKQIPMALADPVAIFKEDQRPNTYVFMLDVTDANGDTVIVPIAFNASGRHAEINLVKTAFGRQKKLWFPLQEQQGLLLYANTKKIQRWNESSGTNRLRGSNADGSSVLNEEDLRKEKAKHPGFYQLSYEEEKGADALLSGNEPNARNLAHQTQGLETTEESTPLTSSIVYQNKQSDNREKFRGAFNTSLNQITLTPNANLSTFAHEMSHWYLNMLFEVSDMDGVNPSIVEDVTTLLKEFGIGSVEEWRSLGIEGQRKHHEKFASWTETYLAEGKAPTKRLEKLFRRFAQWMTAIYRDAKAAIEERYQTQFGEALPTISDEVRRVLDRMVASEDALAESESINSIKPLFDQKPDGMTDEDWYEMMLARDEAEQEGAERILQSRAKDEQWYERARAKKMAEIQRKGAELKKTIQEKIERKINSLPGVVALDLLKKGGSLGVETMKLDPDALWVLGYSEKQIAKLRLLGVLKKGTLGKDIAKMRKTGMSDVQIKAELKVQAERQLSASRELLRPFARFKTNDKMVEAVIAASDRDKMIEDEVTRLAMEKHSEWFDEKKREKVVTEALHNEARARMVATELKYLMNDREGRSRIYREAARLSAFEMIARMPLGKATVKGFMAAESRASRKAYECLKAEDRMGAVLAKRQQLIQHEAVLIALDLEKRAQKLKRIRTEIFRSDKKLAKSCDIDIIGVARYVLTNNGLGKVSPADGDPTIAQKYVNRLKDDEFKYALFQEYIEANQYKGGPSKLNKMTVESFTSLSETVELLYAMAKDARSVQINGRREDLHKAVGDLIFQVNQVDRKRFKPGRDSQVKPNENATFSVLWWESQLLRVEQWCAMMDQGNEKRPFTNYIFRPIANAAARYRVENSKLQEKLVKLIRERQAEWETHDPIDAPEIGYEFKTKQELISALLHTGNQSNKEKLLLGGRGEGKRWAEVVMLPDGSEAMNSAKWDRFIARCFGEGILTKADMDFCQAVWDLLESTKPVAQKAYKEIYGYNFQEIEAMPIQTPFGTYRGGYVPAITDKRLVSERATQEEIERITSQDYLTMMPVTTPGFTKGRVRKYTEPLELNMGLLCGHVAKVLRFGYIAPSVNQVGKILVDRDFDRALFELNPSFVKDMLKPWLKRSYTQSVSSGDNTWIDRKLGRLRSIAGMNIMAGHLLNALQQVTGLSIAAVKVKPRSLAKAMSTLASGKVTIKDIVAKSSAMGSRLADRSIEYESEIARIASTENKNIKAAEGKYNKLAAFYQKAQPARDWIAQHGYFFQTAMQAPIDCIVWLAAYNEACARGLTDVEAVAEADSVVRTTQSDFSPENVSGIEVGSPLYRAFLVFYNYFGMQANLLAESWVTKDYGAFSRDAIMIVFIPSILSAIISNMGFDFDDDDDVDGYDVVRLLIAEPFKNVMAMFPFLGSASATALQNATVKGTPIVGDIGEFLYGDDPYAGRLFSSPALDLLSSSAQGVSDLANIMAGEDVNARRATRNIMDLMTIVTGVPLGAVKRPMGYLAGVAAGDYDASDPTDVAKGLVTGKGEE